MNDALRSVVRDLRYAARSFRKSPGFAVVILLTLGIGIGANTAVFSVVHGVLLRSLPYPEPDRVVQIGWDRGPEGGDLALLSSFKLEFLRERSEALEGVTTFRNARRFVGEGADAEQVQGLEVSADFFRVYGVSPEVGRGFTEEEARPGGPTVTVLSHELWESRFGGDPGLVGRQVRLSGKSRTVVGVMPEGFRVVGMPAWSDFFVPLRLDADPSDQAHNYDAFARLAPGADRARVRSDLGRVSQRLAEAYPGQARQQAGEPAGRFATAPYLESVLAGGMGTALWVLLGAVGIVLLIACANTANLLLARAEFREREISVRAALGASRARVVRQLVTESALLGLAAGVVGLGIGALTLDGLLALAPRQLPRMADVGLHPPVLAFTFAVALLTAVGAGLAAALPASRMDLMSALKLSERSSAGDGGGRLRRWLVSAQVALSLVLLVGAGLMVATLQELESTDLGFPVEELYSVELVTDPDVGPSSEALLQAERSVLRGVRALPGVEGAARTVTAPMSFGLNLPMEIRAASEPEIASIQFRAVDPGYFETLGMKLSAGRPYRPSEVDGGAPVAVANEAFVEEYGAESGFRGLRVTVGKSPDGWVHPDFEGSAPREVTGVVGDVRDISPDQSPQPTVYVPREQVPPLIVVHGAARIVARASPGTGLDRATLAGVVEDRGGTAVRGVGLRPVAELKGRQIVTERLSASLMGGFAVLALVVAAVGLYGVLAYLVARRTREFGLRQALGAERGDILALVMKRGLAMTGIGLAAGLLAALALARLIRSQLYGVSAADPLTYAAVTALLLIVAAAACLVPALRATGVEPLVALESR